MRIIRKKLCTGSFPMPFQFQRIIFHAVLHVRCGFISGWIALIRISLIEIDFPTAYPHLLNEPSFSLVFLTLTGSRISRFHCSLIMFVRLGCSPSLCPMCFPLSPNVTLSAVACTPLYVIAANGFDYWFGSSAESPHRSLVEHSGSPKSPCSLQVPVFVCFLRFESATSRAGGNADNSLCACGCPVP